MKNLISAEYLEKAGYKIVRTEDGIEYSDELSALMNRLAGAGRYDAVYALMELIKK